MNISKGKYGTFMVVLMIFLPMVACESDAVWTFLDAVENHKMLQSKAERFKSLENDFLSPENILNASIAAPCNIAKYMELSPIFLSEETNFADYESIYNIMIGKLREKDASPTLYQDICFHWDNFLECREDNDKIARCHCAKNGVWDKYKGVEVERNINGTNQLQCDVGHGGRCVRDDALCADGLKCTKTDVIYNKGDKYIFLCLNLTGVENGSESLHLPKGLATTVWLQLLLIMLFSEY